MVLLKSNPNGKARKVSISLTTLVSELSFRDNPGQIIIRALVALEFTKVKRVLYIERALPKYCASCIGDNR